MCIQTSISCRFGFFIIVIQENKHWVYWGKNKDILIWWKPPLLYLLLSQPIFNKEEKTWLSDHISGGLFVQIIQCKKIFPMIQRQIHLCPLVSHIMRKDGGHLSWKEAAHVTSTLLTLTSMLLTLWWQHIDYITVHPIFITAPQISRNIAEPSL